MTVPEETLRAVRAAAELLNGGASLGEAGDAVAELAVQRALAYCQRPDVPGDMVPAAAALVLALYGSIPWAEEAGDTGDTGDTGETGDGGETGDAGETGDGGEAGNAPAGGGNTSGSAAGPDWEALLAAGAVKTIQRGDTSITFSSGGSAAASAVLGRKSAALPTVEAALEGLAPWRRLGRLKPEPPEQPPEAEAPSAPERGEEP